MGKLAWQSSDFTERCPPKTVISSFPFSCHLQLWLPGRPQTVNPTLFMFPFCSTVDWQLPYHPTSKRRYNTNTAILCLGAVCRCEQSFLSISEEEPGGDERVKALLSAAQRWWPIDSMALRSLLDFDLNVTLTLPYKARE